MGGGQEQRSSDGQMTAADGGGGQWLRRTATWEKLFVVECEESAAGKATTCHNELIFARGKARLRFMCSDKFIALHQVKPL